MSSNLKVNSLVPATGTEIGIGTTGGSIDFRCPATFGGNVTIGGTLTYDEVINIDSIGVITARSNIDCNGSLDVDGHTDLDNVSIAGVTTITGTGTNGLLKVERASGAGLHIQAQSALGVFGTTSNHNLRLISNGNERILLSTNGNIGINDSSPDTRLSVTAASGTDVVGKFTSTDANAWIQFRDNTTTDTAVMVGANGDNLLLRAGSNERLRITSDGKVGINDNNPANQLVVKAPGGSGHTVASVMSGDASTRVTMQAVQGTEGRMGMATNHPLAIYAGALERLRIGSNGEILTAAVSSEPLYPHYVTARKVQMEVKGALDVGQTRHHGSFAVNCTNSNASIHLVRSDNTQTDGTHVGVLGWVGYDGSDFHQAAAIEVVKGAGAGSDDQPGHMLFKTNAGTNQATERLRIKSDGNITFGHTSSSLPVTSAAIKYISCGRDYWNGTKGDYRTLRFRVYDNGGNIDDQYGIGISAGELELQSQQDIGFYAGSSGSTTGRRALRFRLDQSAGSLDFETNTKLYLKGTVNNPQRHASLNIGSYSNTGETRAIDVWGSWGAGENKSISFNHGANISNLVGQINCIHTSPGSSMRWGKLYHGGDSSTYTLTLDSTSTTGADLNIVNGNLKVASGHGIDFSAQTAASASNTSTTHEILDHYEEGSWSPYWDSYGGGGNAGVFTYKSGGRAGAYTRIGRYVVCSFFINWEAMSTVQTGSYATISGLPFAVGTQSGHNGASEGNTMMINWISIRGNGVSGRQLTGFPHRTHSRVILGYKSERGIVAATPDSIHTSSTFSGQNYFIYGEVSYFVD